MFPDAALSRQREEDEEEQPNPHKRRTITSSSTPISGKGINRDAAACLACLDTASVSDLEAWMWKYVGCWAQTYHSTDDIRAVLRRELPLYDPAGKIADATTTAFADCLADEERIRGLRDYFGLSFFYWWSARLN